MMHEKDIGKDKSNDKYNSKTTNQKKLKFYSTLPDKMIHIKLNNGEFRNCYVKEDLGDGIWTVHERKMGDMHLFEDEIKEIEEYVKLKEEESRT